MVPYARIPNLMAEDHIPQGQLYQIKRGGQLPGVIIAQLVWADNLSSLGGYGYTQGLVNHPWGFVLDSM